MYIKSLICVFMTLLITSCGIITKPEIEQGNIMTPEMISRLHTGMTPPEVIAVMGSPVLTNILTPNRMEYIYTFQNGNGQRTKSRLTCLFQNGRLREIQRS